MKTLEFLRIYADKHISGNDNYGDWLDFEIDEVNTKIHEVKTSLIINEAHLSPMGAAHGGVLSGFLDSSLGCAVITALNRDEICSTVDLNVKFFKPLKLGDKIIAESKVLNAGKTLCSVISKVYKEGNYEQTIALATATFNRYKSKN